MTSSLQGPFLITGASGHLGRRVVDLVLDAQAGPLIVTTRHPDKLADLAARGVEVRAADFTKPETLASAFAGAHRVLIVSTDDLTPGQRFASHKAAIDAAVAAGVRHIVYTSLINPGPDSPISFAGDHSRTEAALLASGIPHTILRNNLYADLFLMTAPPAIASGTLYAAAGDGRVGYVTREDCARAAAAALLTAEGPRTYDITGPELVAQADVARMLAEISGRPVTYVPLAPADLRQGMVQQGLPAELAALLVSIDDAIAKGTLAVVSSAVDDLTGRAPTSVRAFLEAHAGKLTTPAS
ncbi:MAG TPA: SDR family oxidoreductase [Vicinamibacterales bacterium]|jgi:NAD(P)H dehydrogenase (quinone)|nr:SDR family oxidoreductase [Vicinamibacterales bacterium]HWI19706.1 SDR family oxidoreductase [Vicinamibacterales bacterium]